MRLNTPISGTSLTITVMATTGLFLSGVVMEIIGDGQGLPFISSRSSLTVAMVLILSLAAARLFLGHTRLIRWLSSMPAAYSAILGIFIPAVILGLTSQPTVESITWLRLTGFSHILNSWLFLLMALYLLIVLGMSTMSRGWPATWAQWRFLLNHLGLWLILFGALFGAPSVQRLEVVLQQGTPVNQAYDRERNIHYTLPVALHLDNFFLDEWPPGLALVDHRSSEMLTGHGYSPVSVETGHYASLGDYHFYIVEYYNLAGRSGNRWYFNHEPGAAPAAKVNLWTEENDTITGWVSCGSISRPYESLRLNDSLSLVMLFPEARHYRSEISILKDGQTTQRFPLELNKPVELGPYKVYQTDYDLTMGRWSKTSTIELVSDPWLPVVYTGIFILLAGTLMTLGINPKKVKS